MTYYRWRKDYRGLRVDQAKRLKELEEENHLRDLHAIEQRLQGRHGVVGCASEAGTGKKNDAGLHDDRVRLDDGHCGSPGFLDALGGCRYTVNSSHSLFVFSIKLPKRVSSRSLSSSGQSLFM